MEKKLILQNNVSEINKLVLFLEELGEEFGLPADLVFNLNLVLEEAVSNVILYAYPEGEEHEVLLSAKKIADKLIFVLTDSGKEFDPTKMEEVDVTLSAEERPIGGLGIFLIRQIMNTVEYQRIDGQNVLTLSKNLN
ncbi:MAG: ATP-binding protein [Parabacteroides distasonis]|nr:ATP-binding protein [Parabacteroides distasonis]